MSSGSFAAGAACVVAKFQGQTLDYELVFTRGHVSEAQEEGERRLKKKGYGDYYKHLDIVRGQNLTSLPHGYAVVIRSEFKDARGKPRSLIGCGFSASSWDEALWDALRDGQSYFWGWKPDRDGYQVLKKVRF
ncbi:MAG: hypothetical protein D6720_00175 [Gammaproteobacteria bacterium]|nr:MAG: hypothetical protein D6720_00175 [Gammaproteobacteria bacterium]